MNYKCLMIDDDETIAENTAEYFNIFDIKTASISLLYHILTISASFIWYINISGDYLKMMISDHGKGVPADELDLITNKFYRPRDVREGETDGSGLGLYIASAIMEKMNGELICSCRGDGLTVTLMILLS